MGGNMPPSITSNTNGAASHSQCKESQSEPETRVNLGDGFDRFRQSRYQSMAPIKPAMQEGIITGLRKSPFRPRASIKTERKLSPTPSVNKSRSSNRSGTQRCGKYCMNGQPNNSAHV